MARSLRVSVICRKEVILGQGFIVVLQADVCYAIMSCSLGKVWTTMKS